MKVLHIVAGDLTGGAARGAYWLHCGLREKSIESKVLTNSKVTLGDVDVRSVNSTKIDRVFHIVRGQLDQLPVILYPRRTRNIFSTGIIGYNFLRSREYHWADIIHLHWINGFVNISDIARINKPIVWTIRDMWPFTGGCHYALECTNYLSGCGNCKQLASSIKYDLSRWVVNRKKKNFPKTMKVVGISKWITEIAQNSAVFHDFDVRTILNNVDQSKFFPVNKVVARNVLGIDTNKSIILTGAQSLGDFYKGFGKYLGAVGKLDRSNYLLLFFGSLDESVVTNLGFEYMSYGFLSDTVSLRILYSAADVFVAPSVMDAFGKTLAESMACSTPVVCFDATGPRDIVDHKINGYKARPFDTSDLTNGIKWVTSTDVRVHKLGREAVRKVDDTFSLPVISSQYIEMYEEFSLH